MLKENNLKKLQNELKKFKYKCKENCHECCTAIKFLEIEKKQMNKELKKQGYKEPPNGKGSNYCEYLTQEGKCSIYNARPVVCRSFGDLSFLIKSDKKKIGTQTCTYANKVKIVQASKEFIEYGKETITSGILNKNALNVMQEFINSKPLFNIPDNLK